MQTPESHDESYFASFTDMLVGIIFIFIILLMIVANNFQSATKKVTEINESRDKILKEIEQSLKQEGVSVTIDIEQGVLRLPESILFGVDQYQVNEEGKIALSKLASVLEKYLPCMAVTEEKFKSQCESLNLTSRDGLDAVFIEGHTDSTGSSEHNWYLSARRAISVFNELIDAKPLLNVGLKNINGIPILNVSGYEARRPIDPNNLSVNRRIELRFIMRSPTPQDIKRLKHAIG
ncbi:Outer membrane protein and related peptidoglycan-associated (lipo)proteins [Legionella pneumophila]|uniref:OmpA family protein n=5 Tax=Legionella TaxID=445 RepID=A0AAX0WVE6_9GAMM|nr:MULTISPECIES: OmpA family protein [Legionella]AOW52317.1 hypothetical protein BE841_07515 [Legionella pneumophila subsp. pneumophila]AOW54091.1 hypothetical protein BE842_01245 [Legionella pneumophila subsp. pneumophila]AOW63114.1 hypothetical protein BE845_03085 [Legionella pneumophila subsp. pneumophila]AUH72197.1 OmpA family protein [Legionella sainthelensi]AWN73823.1 OmpA family protein [Legionella anisa]